MDTANKKARRIKFEKVFLKGALKIREYEYRVSQQIISNKIEIETKDSKLSENIESNYLYSLELEKHAEYAMKLAYQMANKNPINVGILLQAIIKTSTIYESSGAFNFLSQHLPVELVETVEKFDVNESDSFVFDEPLSKTFNLIVELDKPRNLKNNYLLWGRELITAAILCIEDPSLWLITREANINVENFQDKWFSFLIKDPRPNSSDKWKQIWKEAGIHLPSERNVRAGYLSESTKGDDKLGIKEEAGAFARLISDPNTKPPLSIGLLGDWGSGKSFFMDTMEKEVELIENKQGFCKNIVQIRFNAWHVSDSNLWASIIDHILTEIWKKITPNKEPETARKIVYDKIKEAKGAVFEAEQELSVTREARLQAEEEQKKLAKKLALNKIIEEKKRDALQKAAKAIGWDKTFDAIEDIKKTIHQLDQSSNKTRNILNIALSGKSVKNAILWLTGVIIIAALAYFAISKMELNYPIKELIQNIIILGGSVGSIISSFAASINKAGTLFKNFTDELENTVQKYEDAISNNTELQDLQNNYIKSGEKLKAAQAKLATLEEDQISLDPSNRLISFLNARISSNDYRSRQGIISLVRKDFESINNCMKDWLNNKESPEGINPIDRILLYIDDLDRCSHDVVVQTLEAIHLLLALDLFIVVVAVDSRWLLRSLEVHYHSLLAQNDDNESDYRISTPQNYLEKIFQITYAIAPMTVTGFSEYVDYLMSTAGTNPYEESKEVDESFKSKSEKTIKNGEDLSIAENKKTDETDENTVFSDEALESSDQIIEEQKENETEDELETQISNLRVILFNEHEQKFLKQLHPLISTPRLAKRIVNVYRLIKAKLPYEEVTEYEFENGLHRTNLLLLAILYGQPTIITEVFQKLAEGNLPGNNSNRPIYQGISDLAININVDSDSIDEEKQPDRKEKKEKEEEVKSKKVKLKDSDKIKREKELERLSKIIKEVAPEITIKDCAQVAQEIARYSLVTGQVWHTWNVRKD